MSKLDDSSQKGEGNVEKQWMKQLTLTYVILDIRKKPLSSKIVCHRNDLISKQLIIKTLYDKWLVNK